MSGAGTVAPRRARGGSALFVGTSPPGAAVGSGTRAATAVEALRSRFSRVDVVSMSAPGDESRVEAAVHLVSWAPKSSRWAYVTSLAHGGSPFVGVRASNLRGALDELTTSDRLCRKYDLLWSHFLITAPAVADVLARRKILDVDFSLGAAARRTVAMPEAGRLQRLYLRADAAAISRRERRLCARFDELVVASELEGERLGRVGPPVTIIPNVVPPPDSATPPAHQRRGLLFVGSLDYDVNVDAVSHLVREVLPRVRSRLPGAELTVVGRNPGTEVLALTQGPGMRLVADAPSLDPFYADARAVVVPITSGGGTRIKVIEAMSRGLAVVATPEGIEGLALHHEASVLVGESADRLAEHCLRVLEDPSLADRLGREAKAVWRRDHRPEAAEQAIGSVLDSALSRADVRVSGA